jgi:hypothetical protein
MDDWGISMRFGLEKNKEELFRIYIGSFSKKYKY